MTRQNHIFRKIRKGSQAERLADLLTERPSSAGSRNINTVTKLKEIGMKLVISCTVCGAEDHHEGEAMEATFGKDTLLSEVRPECSACGAKAVSVMPKSV